MTLHLYNTLTRKKEEFTPLDAANVRMYVCGPTVYDRAHLGNARSVVVYDVLFRLLRHMYGAEHVTYARNITDVDDRINATAKERKISIGELTTEVTRWFHEDIGALNVLPASDNKSNGIMIEPKATDHIAEMIAMIERLIKSGKAYVAQGNVMFAVKTMPDYGKLSGRVQEELEAGARIKVEGYKRDPNDFVLWKPAAANDDPSSIFESPWGKGRPGWHIECSAMSTRYLGQDFDIHGGGADLMFPHHENEIAQSCGAYPGSHFARYWVHNGFLTVNGEKMSKSLGNFFTVRDLLDKGIKGEVIRLALLSTGYNKPLDWNDKLISDAKKSLDYFYRALHDFDEQEGESQYNNNPYLKEPLEKALYDDLNFSIFFGYLETYANAVFNYQKDGQSKEFEGVLGAGAENFRKQKNVHAYVLRKFGNLVGILNSDPQQWFKGDGVRGDNVQPLIDARIAAKKAKNWAEADRIRKELKEQGILLEDRPDGTTDWRRG